MMKGETVLLLYRRPRWWQVIRRFREWRSRGWMIGREVEFDGQARTIVDYDPSTRVATVDWSKPPE